MTSFELTWDYRCPFARNVTDHLLTAIDAGAELDVTFRAFSLDQPHVAEGEPPVFDRIEDFPGMLPNLAGIVVRDRQPERFLAVHRAIFEGRHARSLDTRRREVVADLLTGAGVDAGAVLAEVDDGWPVEVARKEHMSAVEDLEVFGVPTFIHGDRAVYVRLLDRADGDGAKARRTVDRILDLLVGWPELNEFKATRVPM